MKLKLILPFLFLVVAFSCKNITGIPDNFDYGKVEGTTYINTYFKFKMPLDSGWEVIDNKVMDSLKEISKEELAGGNEELKHTVEASEVRTAQLLTMVHYDTVAFSLFNTNISILAENVKIAVGVKTGKDYLESAKKLLDQSAYTLDYLGEIESAQVADREFYKMKIVNHYQGFDIHQVYYATIIKGFAFAFVGSYLNEAQLDNINKQIAKMQFED